MGVGVEGDESRTEGRDFIPHVCDREEEGREDGYYGRLAEGEPFDVRGVRDREHSGREVRGELASPSEEADEGLRGLTLRGGGHHSTEVV